jgi:hypothetical protein
MRTAAATFILIGVFATAAMDAQGKGLGRAQGRGRGQAAIARAQGIPPGQLPPAGQCRVWYEGVPPGRQPAPTNCNEAERIASRDADARVIYGDDRTRGDARWRDRGVNDPRNRGIITDQRVRTGRARSVSVNTVPYNNGYRDGLEKGREDAGDRDSYDPVRHSRYRSADRGYDSRYGTKDDYKLVYRDGFEAGYEEGYRNYRR